MYLLQSVKNNLESILGRQSDVIANERDMQALVATSLRDTGLFDKVHFEYRVPVALFKKRLVDEGVIDDINDDCNPAFPWPNSSNFFLDIVVEKDGEFVPIELKYGTRSVDHNYSLFNQDFSNEPPTVRNRIVLLNDQAANDLVMYNYWKDVRRLEVATRLFDNVVGGLAVIMANPPSYWRPPKETANYQNFSTHDGNTVGPGLLEWGLGIGEHIRQSYPAFVLDSSYPCRWSPTSISCQRNSRPEMFQFLISTIGDIAEKSEPLPTIAQQDDATGAAKPCNSKEITEINTNYIIHMAKKSAISGEYIITQEDNDTIRVCQIFDNVKGSLREAAKSVGFEYDPNWTTQQFGSKLIKEFGDGYTAAVGEYTVIKRDTGSIESYRVHGNTIAALRKIAAEAGLTANPKWNTRTFGSVLIDFVNGDYNPNAVEEIEAGLEVKPDMTVQQLWDSFREMFGGHLRIKKGNKRYDDHYNSADGSHHDVIDVALSEIGCNATGRFSPELTVGEFTQKMKNECGLSVVVATTDDWVAVLDDFVLDSVSFIPKNTTKAKMQDILDR